MCLAIPGKIIEINLTDPLMRMSRIDFSGVIKTISLSFTPEAVVGNYVLVHAGFAISLIDEQAAQTILLK